MEDKSDKIITLGKLSAVVVLAAAGIIAALLADQFDRHDQTSTKPADSTDQSEQEPQKLSDDTRELSLEVSWLSQPRLITSSTEFDEILRPTIEQSASAQLASFLIGDANYKTELWETGTVTAGPLADSVLYFWLEKEPTTGGGQTYVRLVRMPDGFLRVLSTYGGINNYFPKPFNDLMVQAPNITVASLKIPPEILTLPDGRKLMYVINNGFRERGAVSISGYVKLEKERLRSLGEWGLYHATWDKVWAGSEYYDNTVTGCVFVPTADGELYWYIARIPVTDKKGPYELYEKELDVDWIPKYSGTKFYVTYTYPSHGYQDPCPHVDSEAEVGSLSVLVRAGTTSEGDPVYAPRDPENHPVAKEVYNSYASDYTRFNLGDRDDDYRPRVPSIREFYEKNPAAVILWKNPFGRWVRYTGYDVVPGLD